MNWRFGGHIQASLQLFERDLLRFEWRANDRILNQRMGLVLSGMGSGLLEDHLLFTSSRCTSWQEFKTKVVNCSRATASCLGAEHVVPMEVSALAKGSGGQRTRYWCGKPGHMAKDCPQRMKTEHLVERTIFPVSRT